MVRRYLATLAGLAVVGGSLAVMGTTATAAAATAPRAAHLHFARQPGGLMHHGHGFAPRVLRNGTTVSSSTNWSGYAAVGNYTSVSANWTQPVGTCTSNSSRNTLYSSFWVGLDGFTDASNTVEQDGTEVDCDGKTPSYYSWYEMYPAYPVNFSNTVKPGDKFYGSVTYDGTTSSGGRRPTTEEEYTLVLQDITEGWSHSVTQSIQGGLNSSAEVITEAPCCQNNGDMLPLTPFSPITYTNATADGQPIGAAANLQEMYIADTSNKVQDTTTPLVSNNSFTNTWLSST
jgi:hypothetical protein